MDGAHKDRAHKDPILELRTVRKTYGDFVAVSGLDLHGPRGAVYGVLGPNGAGKSTTIRMIMNIYLPDSGQIMLNGKPLDRTATDRVAYLPEERGLYRKMKVREHIIYLAQLKGLDKSDAGSKADAWLERFDLADRAHAKVDELSKGMQQKVQFIACVLPEPDLIILDEPFSGLDPINTRLLTDIITEQRQKGRTVLFSTHVLEQAEKICEHIVLIHRGNKVLDGELDAIRESYPIDTIEVAGGFDTAMLEAIPIVARVFEQGTRWRVRLNGGGDASALLAALIERGRVDHFSAVRPPLTDIFVREVERGGLELDPTEMDSAQGVEV